MASDGTIKRSDIIEEAAVKAPYELAQNYKYLEKELNKSLNTFKSYETKVSGSKSTTSLTKNTKDLTAAQVELAKIQKQLSTVQVQSTDQVIKATAWLDKNKRVLKERTELGKQDAKSVTAETASYKQLEAALKINTDAYKRMSAAERDNTEEGKDLAIIISKQRQELNGFKEATGSSTVTLKDLKLELKAIQNELIGLEEGSQAYIVASKKAGELKDQIVDINDNIKASSGDTAFENLGSRVGILGDKLKTADFKGAANQLNNIASLSKQITFKEMTAGIGSFGKAIFNVLKANPIFAIAAAVLAVGAALFAMKDKIKIVGAAFDAIGDAWDWLVDQGGKLTDAIGLTTIAFDKQTEAIVKNTTAIREGAVQALEDQIKLAKAAGESTEQLELRKQRAIIETTRIVIDRLELQRKEGSKLSDEQDKELAENKKLNHDALIEKKVLIIQSITDAREAAAEGIQIAKDEEAEKLKVRIDASNKAWEERRKILEKEADAFKLGLAKIRDIANKNTDKETEDSNKKIKARFEGLIKGTADAAKKIADELNLQTPIEKFIAGWSKGLKTVQAEIAKWGNAIGDLFAAVTAGRLQKIDQEERASEQATKKKVKDEKDALAATLDNETLTQEQRDQLKVQSDFKVRAIEEAQEKRQLEFEKRRRALLRRQAIFEKALALAQAIVAAALAVVQNLKVLPLAIAAGALGALKIAAIAATPIPAAAKGIRNFFGGKILAGEEGPELAHQPGKGWSLLTEPNIYDMQKGTNIYSHKETMRMLATGAFKANGNSDRQGFDNKGIKYELRGIKKAIQGQRIPTRDGYIENGTRVKYLNSLRNR